MSVDLSIDAGIAQLVLNRPDKLNALDAPMVTALGQQCQQIEASAARVVILSGAGKAFCAGGDIEAWSRTSPESFGRHWIRDGHRVFDALAQLRQPVIALLDGHALGGGLELAACADLRIAETHIKIGQPEGGLGIVPGWSGTQRAARRFGAQLVRRMSLFGEVFDAADAHRLGLVDHLVPTGEGAKEAQRLAQAVLARSPRATELTKMMINATDGEDQDRIVDSLAGALAAGSDDLTQGLAAYRAKKPPTFGKD